MKQLTMDSEKAMAPHSSTLAWKIPWTEGPGGLQSIFQNIEAAHTTQYQKNKQPNQKMEKRPKQTFFQRRHKDG